MKPSIAIILCLLVLGVDSQRWIEFIKEAGLGKNKGWGQEVVFVDSKYLPEQGSTLGKRFFFFLKYAG